MVLNPKSRAGASRDVLGIKPAHRIDSMRAAVTEDNQAARRAKSLRDLRNGGTDAKYAMRQSARKAGTQKQNRTPNATRAEMRKPMNVENPNRHAGQEGGDR